MIILTNKLMKLHAPYFRGEIKDNVADVVPSFDLLIPKNKDLPEHVDVSTYSFD